MLQIKQKVTKSLIFSLLAAVILGLFVAYPSPQVEGGTFDDLKAKTAALEAEIAANEEILHGLEAEANTLKGRIAQIQAEINQANLEIDLTQAKIDELTVKLKETEAELERQKNLLAESLRQLYKQGNISTIELLAASDSYTEFINQQEYLARLKEGIQESAEQVQILKDQIAAEKAEQEDLLARLEGQKQVLDQKKSEENQLLAITQGEEAKYSAIVSDLEAQRIKAEEELTAFLARQSFVSQGKVKKGQVIGAVGSSGYSFGPHLHFEVRSGNNKVNPVAGGNSLVYGLSWPLVNSGWGDISQHYGCQSQIVYAVTCPGGWLHGGLDVSGWYGDPVVAAGDGEIIFRGVWYGYGNFVLIDHGGGVFTAYAHLN